MDAEACHGMDDPRDCHQDASGWAPPSDNATEHTWTVRWDGGGMEWSKDGAAFYSIEWSDWFPAGPCGLGDLLKGPDAWPAYPRRGIHKYLLLLRGGYWCVNLHQPRPPP